MVRVGRRSWGRGHRVPQGHVRQRGSGVHLVSGGCHTCAGIAVAQAEICEYGALIVYFALDGGMALLNADTFFNMYQFFQSINNSEKLKTH